MKARSLFFMSLIGCLAVLTMPVYASPTGVYFASRTFAHTSPAAVYFDDGSTFSINTLADKCTGANMEGMSVTFTYLYEGNSYSETVQWTKTKGRVAGGAFVDNSDIKKKGHIISLVERGDTYRGNWVLKAARGIVLQDVIIDGFSGNTVFDTNQITSTPGAGNGKSATCRALSPRRSSVDFTYSDLVMLEGSTGPVGDLYRTLEIAFSGKRVSSMVFKADTAAATPSAAPVPPSLVLIGTGLLFLFGVRRRAELKKTSAS